MEEIKVHCQYMEMVDPATLTPNSRNPNRHPKRQIELLAKIIKTQGWRQPVTVSNRSGFIVRGHGRLEAALLIGCKVPVERQDYASEAEEWADLVADNRIAELASIDNDELAKLLAELDGMDMDMELTGYAGKALDNLLADPLTAIDETIRLLTLRERRMLEYLNELRVREQCETKDVYELQARPVIANVYDELEDEPVELEAIQETKTLVATVEKRQPIIDRILAVEEALTRVTERKIRAIESKNRMLMKWSAQPHGKSQIELP